MRNKKILGLLLAGVMVTSIPFNVFADDEGEKLELSDVTVPVAVAQENEADPTDQSGGETGGQKAGQELTPLTPAKEIVKVTFKAVLVEEGKAEKTIQDLGTPIDVNKGEAIPAENLKEPKKEGYVFGGWYTDEGLTTGFTKTEEINTDRIIYAKFTKKAPEVKKFDVTFYSKGGSTVATQTIEEGKTATKPTAPTRKGYTFKGWYTDDGVFVNRFNFDTEITENTNLYAKWEEEKPAVPTKEDLYISDIEYDGNYVTGKVTSKGEAVKDATVTLKIDGSKTGYKDETDAYGRFKVYLGKYYDDYRYYDDDYYYRNGDRYYDGYRVYKDSDGDYYYIKNGKRNYIRYSNYYRRYRDYKADLVAEKSGFYSAEKNLWKDGYYYNNGRYYGRDWYSNKYDHRVYPTDISRSNYSTSGYLKGYKNRTVYVYDDGTYLGSDTIDSDGYFKVSWNSPRVSTSRSLEYYVNGTYVSDSSYSMIPVVNNVSAGAKFVRGNAGAYADVTVYDSNGTRLGGASAGSTGIFNIS
ncbi:MAG: InlB B-repeat-containing protein, partial [Peptoniphilus sp.]